MVETQLVVEEADHLENLGDLDTRPYLEKKLIEEELDKELNKEVDKEFDYLENLEELELARLSLEVEQATGFQDNVGVTVVMPGEDISKAGTNEVTFSNWWHMRGIP